MDGTQAAWLASRIERTERRVAQIATTLASTPIHSRARTIAAEVGVDMVDKLRLMRNQQAQLAQ